MIVSGPTDRHCAQCLTAEFTVEDGRTDARQWNGHGLHR
jgi:hypothetical protein